MVPPAVTVFIRAARSQEAVVQAVEQSEDDEGGAVEEQQQQQRKRQLPHDGWDEVEVLRGGVAHVATPYTLRSAP
jgi:hypothetical protein